MAVIVPLSRKMTNFAAVNRRLLWILSSELMLIW